MYAYNVRNLCIFKSNYKQLFISRPAARPCACPARAALRTPWPGPEGACCAAKTEFGEGRMGSALMGSLQISCILTEVAFATTERKSRRSIQGEQLV